MKSAIDLRRVYGAFPTGVAAIAAMVDDAPVGIAVSTFVPLSLDPALIALSFARSSETWPRLRRCETQGVSVLASTQSCVCKQIAGPREDRFTGISWRTTSDGAVFVNDAAAWLHCGVEQEIHAGDHDLVVFRVHDLAAEPGVEPLVFHGSTYRTLA